MKRKELSVAIIAKDNADDLKMCDEWIGNATNGEILLVWQEIQKPCDDPIKEIVSRLAQLALGQAIIRKLKT